MLWERCCCASLGKNNKKNLQSPAAVSSSSSQQGSKAAICTLLPSAPSCRQLMIPISNDGEKLPLKTPRLSYCGSRCGLFYTSRRPYLSEHMWVLWSLTGRGRLEYRLTTTCRLIITSGDGKHVDGETTVTTEDTASVNEAVSSVVVSSAQQHRVQIPFLCSPVFCLCPINKVKKRQRNI